jgi:hypothetical protein
VYWTNLELLWADGKSGITDTQLTNLTIIEDLSVSDNPNIKHINHIYNIKTLFAKKNSGIDDNSLIGLSNITELHIDGNKNIYNISHLTTLTGLYAKETNIRSGNFKTLNLDWYDIDDQNYDSDYSSSYSDLDYDNYWNRGHKTILYGNYLYSDNSSYSDSSDSDFF